MSSGSTSSGASPPPPASVGTKTLATSSKNVGSTSRRSRCSVADARDPCTAGLRVCSYASSGAGMDDASSVLDTEDSDFASAAVETRFSSSEEPLSKKDPPRTARRRAPSLRSSIASAPIVACVVAVPVSPSNAQTSAKRERTESDAKGSPRPRPRNSDSSTSDARAAILDVTRDGPFGTKPSPGGSRRSAAAPRPRRLRSNGTPSGGSPSGSTSGSSSGSSSSPASSSSVNRGASTPKPDAAVAYVVVLLAWRRPTVSDTRPTAFDRARASTGFVVLGISAGASLSALSEKHVASSA